MRRLRFALGILTLVVIGGGLILGQNEPIKFRGQLPAGWKKLGLDDTQKSKIYSIREDYRGRIAQLEKKIKELRLEERQELEKVLTDAQKARLKEIKEGKGGEIPPRTEPPKKEEKKTTPETKKTTP